MSTDAIAWRVLGRQLAEPSSFDRLLQQEEELESKSLKTSKPRLGPAAVGNPETKWLQTALNRASAFGIAEDGLFSVQTRRALQKFQAEQGLQPTGKLGPRTRAALIEASGIMAPRRSVTGAATDAAEMETPADGCPTDSPSVIRGFAQYDDAISLLPQDQQNKLAAIAAEIASSQSGAAGVNPVTQVIVVGHADLDAAMEKRNPGFLQYVSEKRADAVLEDLNCRFVALTGNSQTPAKISGRDWIGVGRGARALVIATPHTESERKCNRRAEVILVRSARSPKLPQPPTAEMAADQDLMVDLYHVALQGTSGQYEQPHVALAKAKEIAEKALKLLKFKLRERASKCPALPDLQGFTTFFKDALQGTASKYPNTDDVVNRAAEIADYAGFTMGQAVHRLEWKQADLPQPMSCDCELVRGQVPGPANHVLCSPHGHIVDSTAKLVIAHDLDEYQRQFRR